MRKSKPDFFTSEPTGGKNVSDFDDARHRARRQRISIPKISEARLEYADLLQEQAQRAPEPYRTKLLAEGERMTAEAQQLRKRPR